MTANQVYLPKPIQPDDNRGFAGFEHNGLIYQSQRLATRQPIVIASLDANTVYEISFSALLAHDLLVTGITADIAEDDGNVLQQGQRQNYDFTWVQLIIQTLDPLSQRVLRTINVFVSSNTNVQNELIVSPHYLYRFQINHSVNDITFLGLPVIVEPPVVIVAPPTVEPVATPAT